MRRLFGIAVGASALALTAGCHTSKKHDLTQPHVEEFNPPPEEARYNNPPEDRYRKRKDVTDQAAKMGNNGGLGPAPGLSSPGMGGR